VTGSGSEGVERRQSSFSAALDQLRVRGAPDLPGTGGALGAPRQRWRARLGMRAGAVLSGR
jgi:hypothetical protein